MICVNTEENALTRAQPRGTHDDEQIRTERCRWPAGLPSLSRARARTPSLFLPPSVSFSRGTTHPHRSLSLAPFALVVRWSVALAAAARRPDSRVRLVARNRRPLSLARIGRFDLDSPLYRTRVTRSLLPSTTRGIHCARFPVAHGNVSLLVAMVPLSRRCTHIGLAKYRN